MSGMELLQVMSPDGPEGNASGQTAASSQGNAATTVAFDPYSQGHGLIPPGGSVVLMQERRTVTIRSSQVDDPMSPTKDDLKDELAEQQLRIGHIIEQAHQAL